MDVDQILPRDTRLCHDRLVTLIFLFPSRKDGPSPLSEGPPPLKTRHGTSYSSQMSMSYAVLKVRLLSSTRFRLLTPVRISKPPRDFPCGGLTRPVPTTSGVSLDLSTPFPPDTVRRGGKRSGSLLNPTTITTDELKEYIQGLVSTIEPQGSDPPPVPTESPGC